MSTVLVEQERAYLIDLLLDVVAELSELSEEDLIYATDLVDRAKAGLQILNYEAADDE